MDEKGGSIRTLSRRAARAEILLLLLRRREGLDYLEIANALDIDLGFTIAIVDDLIADGVLKAVVAEGG